MSQRQNTNNLMPSNALADLNDNTISLDEFVNSTAATTTDRFSNKYKTVKQLVKDVEAQVAAAQKEGYVKIAGDTMTGDLSVKKQSPAYVLSDTINNSVIALKFSSAGIFEFNYYDGKWSTKYNYNSSNNSFNFTNLDRVTINNMSVLKQGDHGLGNMNKPVEINWNEGSPTEFVLGYGKNNAKKPDEYGPETSAILTGYKNRLSGGVEIYRVTENGMLPINWTGVRGAGTVKWFKEITTINSTVDSNGFLKSASPILRLFANDDIDAVDGFTKSGYGFINSEAKGVTAKRIGVGHYEIHGSIGFAKVGWYITLPEDANGNKKIFAHYQTDNNHIITVKTYQRRFDVEQCEIVAGEPIDIPPTRWIDIRLEVAKNQSEEKALVI